MRLIAWNCQHGSVTHRLAALAPYGPAIVFLQECGPTEPVNGFVTRLTNTRKGVALGSLGATHRLVRLRRRANAGNATLAATVTGAIPFTVLGIWSQGPRYAHDVLRTIEAYRRVLRSGPAVVMGDLNVGANLADREPASKGHRRIVDTLAALGLVSAYHAFHDLEHGAETHPTYRHQRNASRPWHIDYCFIPASWTSRLVSVRILDGKAWAGTSDHLPLVVDIRLPATAGHTS